jgi:hypothetical protein
MYHSAFSLGKYTRRASKRFCPEICDLHVQILLQKVQFVCENDVSAAFVAEHFFVLEFQNCCCWFYTFSAILGVSHFI